jgi:hypothetical protein
MVEWKKTQMEITTSRGGGRQRDSNREELFPKTLPLAHKYPSNYLSTILLVLGEINLLDLP